MMPSTDVAFERLRNANPVPDPSALRTQEGIADPTHVQTLRSLRAGSEAARSTGPTPPEQDPNRWMPALVAAIVVALLVVTIQLLTPEAGPTPEEVAEEETTIVDDPTSAVPPFGLMQTFVESPDPVELRSVLDPDTALPDGLAIDDYVTFRTEWLPAAGVSQRMGPCDVFPSNGDTVIRCDTVVEITWRTQAGLDPLDSEYRGVVEDGRFVSIVSSATMDAQREIWDPFLVWLDDVVSLRTVEAMVTDAQALWPPLLTDESIELWDRYTTEYVEFVQQEATVRSMISGEPGYDPDGVVAMFTPDAVMTAASVDDREDWPAWGDYLDAIGIERTDLTCSDGGVLGDVACSFTYTDRIMRALGLTSEPSIVEMWITFDDDGRVIRWSEEVTLTPDAYQGAFVDFWTWIETNHPDDFPSMIDLDNGYDVTLEPDVIARFEQYTREYIDSVRG